MTEIHTNSSDIGQIQIADEVVAVIAGTAVSEVDGVISLASNIPNELAGMIGKKNLSKGVKVSINDKNVAVEVAISVKYGFRIQDVSSEVQKRVKNAIETMTGLNVESVDVNISGVQAVKESPKS